MQMIPGFGASAPAMPPPPPPTPTPDDPAIAAAKEKNRLAMLQRGGRASTILTGNGGELGDTTVTRPTARSATLLGD